MDCIAAFISAASVIYCHNYYIIELTTNCVIIPCNVHLLFYYASVSIILIGINARLSTVNVSELIPTAGIIVWVWRQAVLQMTVFSVDVVCCSSRV